MNVNLSTAAIIAGLTAFGCLALAAILFVAPGPESQSRLALFFGLMAIVIPALLAALRSDQSASNTNGKLDARIQSAVHRANDARRRGDAPQTPAEIDNEARHH